MSGLIKADTVARKKCEDIYLVDCGSRTEVRRRQSETSKTSPKEQAEYIIGQAKQEAEILVAEAEERAESIRAAAYEEGYQAGLRELDAGKAMLNQRMESLKEEVTRQVSDYWVSIEPEVLSLAVEIARKITRHEIDENKSIILTTVKAGIEQLRERRELKLRVNPADYEFVREHKDEITESYDGVRSVEVVQDRRVESGGCIIESANGHLDGRTETQIKEVERALLEASQDGKFDIPAESE